MYSGEKQIDLPVALIIASVVPGATFYVRRVLRLFPALYALLAVLTMYALLFGGGRRHDFLREVGFAAVYFSNFGWLHGLVPVWLGHFWSLALEEQFYLLWPPILVLCLKRPSTRKFVAPVLAIVVLFCSFVRLRGGLGVYAVLDQRPDALLIGVLTAFAHRRFRNRQIPLALAGIITGLSILVLLFGVSVASVWVHDKSGPGSVVVALATAALIVSCVIAPHQGLARVLASRIPVEIGKRSYGLYLWHAPIFHFIGEHDLPWADPLVVALKYSVTFAVVWTSYRFIETPALRLKERYKSV
jgi:peptidoglycan/LPS O-acetylase OafA/YrhL